MTPNQLEDRDKAYPWTELHVHRKNLKKLYTRANNECLRAAKLIQMGKHPSKKTTKIIKTTIPENYVGGERWGRDERRKWETKAISMESPAPEAQTDSSENGEEAGRSRTRISYLKVLQSIPDGIGAFARWTTIWMRRLTTEDEVQTPAEG